MAAGPPGTLVYSVAKAALDRRSFRGLVLANGLRVLLASDPDAAKGAASMDVLVGSMSDPPSLPGLAHFCEHMLFLGTKAFPEEGEFEQYIANYGGSNNAYTASEDTNYFFDVQGSGLPGALERFAGFFTAPLFTPAATGREVSAIESEHSKNLQSDFWRYEELFKLRADPNHPYSKFSTGNRRTLHDGDDATRDALLSFHRRFYQADQMSLALVGPQSLDELQSLALRHFAAVPAARPALLGASTAYDGLPLPFNPAREPPRATLMVPVKEMRELKVAWCLPVTNLNEWLDAKPEGAWSLLVRNRGRGGLLPLLKRKGLANGLDANVEEFSRAFVILSVSIDLTPLGLSKWRDVSGLLFASLRTLSAAGVPPYVVEEYRTMARTGFEYAEPSRPSDFATDITGSLPFFEPERWISGPNLVGSGTEEGATFMLDWTRQPRNALITLVAKQLEVPASLTEPIYGTKYATLPLTREVEAWEGTISPAELRPPLPNPFIPTDFALKCGGAKAACIQPARPEVAPTVLANRPGLTLHFLQDATFKRPRAFAFFLFRSPLLYASAEASITAQLFQSTLGDTLQESTYQAGLAGLGAGVGAEYNGLFLSASGYSSRLPELLQYVAAQVKTATLEPSVFERTREALQQELANFEKRQPVGLCSYYRQLALETPRYPIEQLQVIATDDNDCHGSPLSATLVATDKICYPSEQAAVSKASIDDVRRFQGALLPESLLECFFAGNLDAAEAEAITAKVTAALPASSALAPERIPRRRVRVVPVGRTLRQYVAPNAAEANSATEVFCQVGKEEGDNWLCLAVLSQLIEQPLYGELRTKQQLGYIVQSSVSESEGVRSLVFSVQSAVQPPPEVERRIDAFLASFRPMLAQLPESELKTVREALASQVTDVDQRLGQQASRLWTEIVTRRYDYDRPWRSAKRLRGITREQLLNFFDAHVAPGAPEARRLVTHVYAKATAPDAPLVVNAVDDEFYLPQPDRFGERVNVV